MSIWLVICAIIAGTSHDVHISYNQININSSAATVELMTVVFLDDLETAMESTASLRLFSAAEHPMADSLVLVYLQSCMPFHIAGDTLQWQMIGKEVSEDLAAGRYYVEAALPVGTGDLMLVHRVLFDVFADQQSICDVRRDGSRVRHLTLTSDRPSAIVPLSSR